MRVTLFFILLLLLSIKNFSQKDTTKYDFENTISGIWSNRNIITLSIQSENSFRYKGITTDLKTNYLTTYSSNRLLENEFFNSLNIITKRKIFLTNQQSFSFERKTKENLLGVGLYFVKNKNISFSYAILNQRISVTNPEWNLRHSFKIGIRLENKIIKINSDYYYQPNIINSNDYNILGNIKIYFFPKNRINLTLQDNLNFKSISTVKLIHSLTLGFTMTFKL